MKLTSFLKLGLFFYELIRTLYLVINLILQASDSSIFIKMIFASQGALLPLAALFLCLNTTRFKEYIPLYIAGKSIGIFTLLMWSLISQGNQMIGDRIGEMTLVAFDLFSLAIILIIKNDFKNAQEIKNKTNEAGNIQTHFENITFRTKKITMNMLKRRKNNAYHTNSKRKRRSGKIFGGGKSCSGFRASGKTGGADRP
ncbi:MAG: hypothetical protein FWB86_08730 [Treponema sp.]|nr:hypothetical protein [Treponema sp.]MCL2252509.1 hypothetical protein [Treponema sp.]